MAPVDTVRRFVAAFNARNAYALMGYCAPDMVEHTAEGETYYGAVDVNRYQSVFFHDNPDVYLHDLRLAELPDGGVVATWRLEAKDQNWELRPYTRYGLDFYTVEGSAVASRETFWSPRNVEQPPKFADIVKRYQKDAPGATASLKAAKAYADGMEEFDAFALSRLIADDAVFLDDNYQAWEGKDAVMDGWLTFFERDPAATWAQNEPLGADLFGLRRWQLATSNGSLVEGADVLYLEGGKILVVDSYSRQPVAQAAAAAAQHEGSPAHA
jgi:ketosteroid isomerase-like protein